ncbi:MAG: hypothetical protein NZ898_01675 [Myxococcota bacterium]|nr:hypothetical protein [Myxococcota bacterium]MDW8362727.1 hypothetical protein [Myxococcales bacterium]
MTVPAVAFVAAGEPDAGLIESLRARGYRVERRDAQEPPLDVAVLFVSADVDGALDVARRWRTDSNAVRICFVGDPLGAGSQVAVRALGADAYLPRPVTIDALVAWLETTLRSGSERHDVRDGSPPAVQALTNDVWRPPERTLRLDGEAAPDASLPGIDPSVTADGRMPFGASPFLERLFREADRAMFPGEPPIVIRLAVADEPAEVLVPDDALEQPVPVIDVGDEEGPDGLTFVGPAADVAEPVDGLSTAGPKTPDGDGVQEASDVVHVERDRPSSSASAREAAVATSAPARDVLPSGGMGSVAIRAGGERTVGGTAAGRRSIADRHGGWSTSRPDASARLEPAVVVPRQLEVGGVELLAELFRLIESRARARVRLVPVQSEASEPDPARDPLVLCLDGSWLEHVEGPIGLRVLRGLRDEGRADASPDEDLAAETWLARAVREGRVGRLEIERRRWQAVEDLVADAIGAPTVHVHIEPEPESATRAARYGRDVGALLVEAARRRIDVDRLRRWLGPAVTGVAVTAGGLQRMRELGVEPEIVGVLGAAEGVAIDALLAVAEPASGMPGLLAVLVAAGALRPLTLVGDAGIELPARADPVASARRVLEHLVALAEEGDYFAMLGVGCDASAREIELAHARRVELLDEARHVLAAQGDVEEHVRFVARALDEARSLMGVERWRMAYAAAIRAGTARRR